MGFYGQAMGNLESKGIRARERRLLYMLEVDARVRLSGLSSALKISKEACRQKIAKMEKGAVAGYQTIINLPKIGVESFRVYVALSCKREERQAMLDFLMQSKKIWWVLETNGEWDFDFVVWAGGNWEFWLFWKEFYGKFGDIIKNCRINTYTELVFLPRTFLVRSEREDSRGIRRYDAKQRISLDKKEMLLLSDIAFRGRDSFAEISKRTRLSIAYVSQTMRKLEKQGVILGYRALIDRNYLGLDYYKADVRLSSTSKLKALEEYVLGEPFAIYIDNVIGGSSFEFDFLAVSSDHAKEILDSVRAICGSSLNHLEFFQILGEFKLAHFPPQISARAL